MSQLLVDTIPEGLRGVLCHIEWCVSHGVHTGSTPTHDARGEIAATLVHELTRRIHCPGSVGPRQWVYQPHPALHTERRRVSCLWHESRPDRAGSQRRALCTPH